MCYQVTIFTARKRSLGQGNIFIGVCQEFCSRGGGCLIRRGVCSGGSCLLLGGCLLPGGVSTEGGCLLLGGVSAAGGVVCPWGVSALGNVCSQGGAWWRPPNGYCCGRYASYWNAFLCFEIYTTFKKFQNFGWRT